MKNVISSVATFLIFCGANVSYSDCLSKVDSEFKDIANLANFRKCTDEELVAASEIVEKQLLLSDIQAMASYTSDKSALAAEKANIKSTALLIETERNKREISNN